MSQEAKRVVLIGCGGIGTYLGLGLAKTLQFHAPRSVLILVDGDSFETKNAERQNFSSLGNKAHVLRDDLQRDNHNIFCIANAAWIVSDEVAARNITEEDESDNGIIVNKISASSLLEEDDLVYVCVDNYAARKLVFDAAKTYTNIDVFTGGNDERLFGSVYHYRRRDAIDITLPPDIFHTELENPPDKNPGEMSCQERAEIDGGTQILAINMGVAAVLLAKTSHLVFGTEAEQAAALEKAEIFFDLEEGLSLTYDRRPTPVLESASATSSSPNSKEQHYE